MKPIETVYRGYRFRSRLEARWAVFYDTLGVPYSYEPQGFNLDGAGLYLPDFWLPQQDCWIEIKGQQPKLDSDECRKAYALAMESGKRVFIFYGDIPYGDDLFSCPQGTDDDSAWLNGAQDYHYLWCQCVHCGKPGIEFDGRSARICGLECHGKYQSWPCNICSPEVHAANGGRCKYACGCGDKEYNYDTPLLRLAYDTARQARFEHGESGEGHG